MRIATFVPFVFAATLLQEPALWAAQRPVDMPLYQEIERFLSPNELQLAELQRERQDLLKNREKEKNARILRNKITILNNKITFLQRQIKLTNPNIVTQRLVHINVKGAQSAERLEPVEVSLPPIVALPYKINAKALAKNAPRESAVVQTLRLKMEAKPFSPVQRKQSPGKTGVDWKKMALADKEIYILSVMRNLSRRDVYLMRPYSFYIKAIDQVIEKDSSLEKELIHRILMTAAYDSEPDTRKDLEKVWK